MNKLNNIKNIELLSSVVVFSGILYVLIFNLFHYDQMFGYDGEAHSAYVDNFLNMYRPGQSDKPSSDFTYEFFSPPLPYLFPTIMNEFCKIFLWTEYIYKDCRAFHSFNNIIFQSILFLLTLFLYMKIVKIITDRKSIININVLLLLGIFTANYKTVAMLRGETYILFLNSLILYFLIRLFKKSFFYNKKDLLIFGFLIGLLALSRQWAFLLFPGYFIIFFLIQDNEFRKRYFKFLFIVFSIGFIISSWFYFNLYFEYGTFTAFNKEPVPFKFSNQPLSFYLPYGDEVSMVFTKPIRPYFQNQFLPILYSDLWGDYWGYFAFTSRALDIGKNQLLIGDYLARVNIVSLVPSFFLILGIKYSFKNIRKKTNNPDNLFMKYICISVVVSFFGFVWFLINYPEPSGDTNKATYIIHLFHLLGILTVFYFEKLKKENLNKFYLFTFLLVIVFFHNLSAMMSHFPYQEHLRSIFFFYS